MSLLPKTEGRSDAEVLDDVQSVMEKLRNTANSNNDLDSQRAQLLRSTLDDVKQTLLAMEGRTADMAAADARKATALLRDRSKFSVWDGRLQAKEREADLRELEEAAHRREVESKLDVALAEECNAEARAQQAQVVQDLAGEIAQIAELTQCFDEQLGDQGGGLDTAQENVEATKDNADQALGELKGALKHSYGWTGSYVGLATGIVAGSAALVGGIALAPAAGVAAATAVAGRYVGKKVAKVAVNRNTKDVDKHLAQGETDAAAPCGYVCRHELESGKCGRVFKTKRSLATHKGWCWFNPKAKRDRPKRKNAPPAEVRDEEASVSSWGVSTEGADPDLFTLEDDQYGYACPFEGCECVFPVAGKLWDHTKHCKANPALHSPEPQVKEVGQSGYACLHSGCTEVYLSARSLLSHKGHCVHNPRYREVNTSK